MNTVKKNVGGVNDSDLESLMAKFRADKKEADVATALFRQRLFQQMKNEGYKAPTTKTQEQIARDKELEAVKNNYYKEFIAQKSNTQSDLEKFKAEFRAKKAMEAQQAQGQEVKQEQPLVQEQVVIQNQGTGNDTFTASSIISDLGKKREEMTYKTLENSTHYEPERKPIFESIKDIGRGMLDRAKAFMGRFFRKRDEELDLDDPMFAANRI